MLAHPMIIAVGTNQNHVKSFVNLFETADEWNKDEGWKSREASLPKGIIYMLSGWLPATSAKITLIWKDKETLDLKLSLQSVLSKP